MTDYLEKKPIKKKSLEKVVTKLAIDGITFRTIVENEVLRELSEKSGYQWPRSANTVRSLIMKHFEEIKAIIIQELKKKISEGERYSITFDEYTSTRNRRFLNVIIIFWVTL